MGDYRLTLPEIQNDGASFAPFLLFSDGDIEFQF